MENSNFIINCKTKKNPVYILDINGNPLMPTWKSGKVRYLLNNKLAKIVKYEPFFTIQLKYELKNRYIQKLSLGVDTGITTGLSVTSYNPQNNEITEYLSSEFKSKKREIINKLKDRSSFRRIKRNNKTRYRKKRFDNRSSSKGKCKVCGGNLPSAKKNKNNVSTICGACLKISDNNHKIFDKNIKKTEDYRLSPSSKYHIDVNKNIIKKIQSILPIKDINVEKTLFDTHKAKNPNITNDEYQKGEMFGFSHTREYVLHRDGHKCMNPECKHKKNGSVNYVTNNIPLRVHHIIYKSNGGKDIPENLISLCIDCHTPKNHKSGILSEWNSKKLTAKSISNETHQIQKSYAEMPDMSKLYKHICLDNEINVTGIIFGCETKRSRQLMGLEKEHTNDAFAISLKQNFDNIFTKDKNIIINKIENKINIVKTTRHNRKLGSDFTDNKYIDVRDNILKSGCELSKEDRKFRSFKKSSSNFIYYLIDRSGNYYTDDKNNRYRVKIEKNSNIYNENKYYLNYSSGTAVKNKDGIKKELIPTKNKTYRFFIDGKYYKVTQKYSSRKQKKPIRKYHIIKTNNGNKKICLSMMGNNIKTFNYSKNLTLRNVDKIIYRNGFINENFGE
ncbi:MAG: RRXRR domain-containing protein [bacterium]